MCVGECHIVESVPMPHTVHSYIAASSATDLSAESMARSAMISL